MAIDFTTAVGKVRLITADFDDVPLLSDAFIEGYLGLHKWAADAPTVFTDQLLWLASADILEAMATTESLLSKKITTQDLSTDGPAVAADLRKQAATLRGKAAQRDAEEQAAAAEDVFMIVPQGGYGKPEGAERYW